ncbi:MAG TPA: CAAX prenyl protease-related protein, partial [Isosphaeraceae bacterium]
MSVAEPSTAPAPTETPAPRLAWLPYVAPMATFLLLTNLEGYPPPAWYPLAYAAKVAIVTAVVIACRSTWRDLRPRPSTGALALAVGVGLAVTAVWVGLDGLYPTTESLGKRAGFDPGSISSAAGRLGFIAARLYGLVLLVPLFEELFWRSFAIRYIVDPDDFTRVPIGKVTPTAAVATAVVFAMAHPVEWLPALLTGLAWAWLVHRTQSVSACVVSHAT